MCDFDEAECLIRQPYFFTTGKQNLGQGNVFIGVCLSTGGFLYDVTSCLAVWSHVPSGGSLYLVPCSLSGGGGLCQEGGFLSRRRSLFRGPLSGGFLSWVSLSGGSLFKESFSRKSM